MGLEKEVKAAEERRHKVAGHKADSREATVLEAKLWAIDEFIESEEYKTSQDYDVRFDNGYDKGVEEIFFNIWRKSCEVNYRFLGKGYQQLMAD